MMLGQERIMLGSDIPHSESMERKNFP